MEPRILCKQTTISYRTVDYSHQNNQYICIAVKFTWTVMIV